MAVGGLGMVTTANYLARPFGVRSAMPGFIAKKLCPDIVFVRPDFTKYTKAAEEVCVHAIRRIVIDMPHQSSTLCGVRSVARFRQAFTC